MSKFKIGQRVKIINFYPPYNNITGIIIHDFGDSFYRVCLDIKFYKRVDRHIIDPIVHEKSLVLANGNLIVNE